MQDYGWMQMTWSPPYKHIKTFPEGHNLCALKGFFSPCTFRSTLCNSGSFYRSWIPYQFWLMDHLHLSVWECRKGISMWRLAFATFKGEQCPLQRAERRGIVSGIDLLKEAIRVMAPQRTCKAVDSRCQLPTNTWKYSQ